MHALGCLFVLLIIGFVLIVSIVRGVLSFLFGGLFGRGGRSTYHQQTYSRNDYEEASSSQSDYRTGSGPNSQSGSWTGNSQSRTNSSTGKKKLIGEDEGEYVDFEEVK